LRLRCEESGGGGAIGTGVFAVEDLMESLTYPLYTWPNVPDPMRSRSLYRSCGLCPPPPDRF
jgi:hypothetical protein